VAPAFRDEGELSVCYSLVALCAGLEVANVALVQ